MLQPPQLATDVLPPLQDSTTLSTTGHCVDLVANCFSITDFTKEQALRAYEVMYTSRRLDEKMLMLLKQNKGFFHIGGSGHEAIQMALGMQMEIGTDWAHVYYRDLCLSLAMGITPREVLLHHLAKADDPFSGGRQMSEHFCSKALNIVVPSAEVGSQFLPAAGLALALKHRKQKGLVYVGCGDGATSQGAFFEALNWASRDKAPVLFVVQDNGIAISVPVKDQTAGGSAYKLAAGFEGLARIEVDGTDLAKSYAAVSAARKHILDGNGPVMLVAQTVRLLPHSSSDNHAKYRPKTILEAEKKRDPMIQLELQLIEAGFATEQALHDLKKHIHKEIDHEAHWAAKQADPDPKTLHHHVLFDGDLGLKYEQSKPSGPDIVVVDAINNALKEEMTRDKNVIVYGEDVADGKGGVFTATRDLSKLFGHDRCFNSPLAENSIIGTAVGFSLLGYKPVVEIQFADYVWPGLQAIRNMVSTFRWRSNNMFECPMVIRIPTGGYIHGGLCHSQNIEAFFAHMPGLVVVMPSNAADAKGLLKTAIRSKDPILFLEHKFLYRQPVAKTPEPDENYLVPIGKAKLVQEGSDLTIVTYGALVYKALAVSRALEKKGVSTEIIDIRTIIPFDSETVIQSVKKTNRVMVLHEDHEFMGFGAEIAAQITQKAFRHLDAPVKRVAGTFTPSPFSDVLERASLPQDADILAAANELLSF
ncbi:MAG: dehydrogenase E1 component subunit alpha/beta [Bacteroidetes Order II. Incertae sedis bacterium]|nr:dehydrogenase E1 component subunit alpha/beta [Bacteroidetes Order II. bacterium]